MSYNLRINTKTLCNADYALRKFWRTVNFKTMTHIEYFIHFLPVGAGFLLNHFKQGRNREHIVFYNSEFINKMENFGLRTA